MKKFLAMLLAAMMLLSSVGALAEEETFNQYEGGNQISFTAGASDANDDSRLEIDPALTSRYQNEKGTVTGGDVKTELWMQVDASGQIDVTVPLVLVFSTNVDGGKATAAENYKIYNNNTRNSVAVDKIVVTDQDANSTKLMTLETKTDFEANEIADTKGDRRNYYYVVFEPASKINVDGTAQSANKIGLAMNTQLRSGTDNDSGSYYYDMKSAVGDTTAYNKTTLPQESVMTIGQGGYINLNPTMETTPLNFVTDGFASTGSDGLADEFTKGVHLLTVTYTVGLQYEGGKGSQMSTTDDIEIISDTNPNP